MTTDEERLENFEEINAKLDKLKITVAAMRQRQEERIQQQKELLAEMREDAEKRDRPDEEDGNSDGDGA